MIKWEGAPGPVLAYLLLVILVGMFCLGELERFLLILQDRQALLAVGSVDALRGGCHQWGTDIV